MKTRAGFTLMELLVVLMIIGIMSTVALRTIDATRNRALFDQTADEMDKLVKAMVGNPDIVANGRRIDFGFYGDMNRLPNTLEELVRNTSGSQYWHGPYFRRKFLGDSTGYLYDAWGNPYTYDRTTGQIATIGNGKYPMTVRVADSLPQLANNTIVGTVTDGSNNPPGDADVRVKLHFSNGLSTPLLPVGEGGYYSIDNVPIGTHRLGVYYLGDSISRWVSVAQRSRNVVDFRFSQPFRDFLGMVGPPILASDSTGFTLSIVNDHTLTVDIENIHFVDAPDSAYFRDLRIGGESRTPVYPLATGAIGFGSGDTAPIGGSGSYPVPGNRTEIVVLGFLDFYKDRYGATMPAKLNGETFRLRFSDGSEITFTLPVSP